MRELAGPEHPAAAVTQYGFPSGPDFLQMLGGERHTAGLTKAPFHLGDGLSSLALTQLLVPLQFFLVHGLGQFATLGGQAFLLGR